MNDFINRKDRLSTSKPYKDGCYFYAGLAVGLAIIVAALIVVLSSDKPVASDDCLISPDMVSYMETVGHGQVFTEGDFE